MKLVINPAFFGKATALVIGSGKPEYPEILEKAGAVEDEDGVLTQLGMSVAERYARKWVRGDRDVELEREYPDLQGLFYDIRLDPALARRHAS